MPLRLTLTLEGASAPLFPPELIVPGDSGGCFDYSAGEEDGVFLVVSCLDYDMGGIVYAIPEDELPIDGEGDGYMYVTSDTLALQYFKAGIDRGGRYDRDVVAPVGVELQAGHLVVEHIIGNLR